MQPIFKKTIVNEVICSIMEAIRSGELSPGARFPSERTLAEHWSISRTSVREALKALADANIITIKPRSGIFLNSKSDNTSDMELIASLDEKDMEERLQARFILERQIVRLAALNATTKTLNLIKKSLDMIDKGCQQTDVEMLLDADYSFHQAISVAAQNRYLQQAYDAILLAGPEWVGINRMSFKQRVDITRNYHHDIFEAIKSGDPELAEKMTRSHEETVWLRYGTSSGNPLKLHDN